MPLLGFTLAALIGLSLGLLGGGGSILTVPILVYVLGFDPKQSIAMGLAVVGMTSLVGAASHWRKGNVRLRASLPFAALTMAGTYAGARFSVHVPGVLQLVLFAIIMLVAAFFMFRNSRADAAQGAERAEGGRPGNIPLLVLSALGVGSITGLVGVGGGFLIVPTLVLLLGLPMKQAVGTSLLVIALNSFVGFAGYLGHVVVPWGYLAGFTAVAVVGILVGTWASHFVSQASLKRAFSVFLVVMGAGILMKNRDTLARLGGAQPVTATAPAPAAAASSTVPSR
ncbi:sulfite exporter TauE/SafE family protein [Corallococcus sp. H22C18031201]|uniref:sulfite exporter TauE/SafE family protein n=1 Tax=Citreicoccus inhibens TaxID=2849499 RepID=UPI000E7261F6|nr:sulfite exporter TauE/SafE family protein [Citreicoccus inhibens]MBU8896494.1 sulfite exporter TauE/SafE family protein [Citreicoccus inhibens]RJS18788.1 sulfite exporter TauE/SafE family protein [Corallococcus sp. H22C18031201]